MNAQVKPPEDEPEKLICGIPEKEYWRLRYPRFDDDYNEPEGTDDECE